MSSSVREGTRSSRAIASGSASSCSLPASPMVPPRNTLTPGTAFILPSAFIFLAGPPMRPMSPACAWPHELGQPVQWMRTSRSSSTRSSSLAATSTALFLVSISAKPQNCAPVQLTRLAWMRPGATDILEPPLSSGSASSASTSSSRTLGRMKFCSTVRRISPPLYLSARSATPRASATDRRPTGTCTPTRESPSWGCACAPT
mmetsp:Transcript_11414/g.47814  ORF Transcript_11414/g.47814 Transcript_11414/m.47814 type:complete len:203 (+) Transcript_11414:343-951(+)